MAVILKKEENGCLFGLWKIDETEEELMQAFANAPAEEKVRLEQFKNPNRRIERIVTRLLIYELLGEQDMVEYDKHGKPYLKNHQQTLSISHTTGMVAVQICDGVAGVDIEKISGRVARIAHKFLSPVELDQMQLEQQLLQMYVYWCAKETIYKIHGEKGLDFKKHIRIEPFDINEEGSIRACLNKTDEKYYLLDYFIYDAGGDNKYMVVKYSK